LTGFIDQAGSFLPNGAVANKLHLLSLPVMLIVWMLLGTARGEIQLLRALPGYA